MCAIRVNDAWRSVSLCPDSIGTKLGGKPGGKKPFKPYNNTERKGRPWKGGDGDKKQQKFAFSKAGNGPQKRKLPHFKGKNEEDSGEGEKRSAAKCYMSHDAELKVTEHTQIGYLVSKDAQ